MLDYNPYDFSNISLISKLKQTCRKAGVGGGALGLINDADYIGEVLHARADHREPPFKPEDLVLLTGKRLLHDDMRCFPPLQPGYVGIIAEVRYIRFGTWRIVLTGTIKPNGERAPHYKTNRFKRVDDIPNF